MRDEASSTAMLQTIRKAAIVPPQRSIAGKSFLRSIVDAVPREARYVLIGEASHGTDEFYRMRADITKELITERGFNAVAVEADFPDAFKANMWVRGLPQNGTSTTAEEALSDFIRFPTWMWRNTAVRDFLNWLRAHNDGVAAFPDKVGFYGIDVYSLHTSAAKVVDYLNKVDPELAGKVHQRYQCFDRYGEDAHDYARATGLFQMPSCAGPAVAALRDVLQEASTLSEVEEGEFGWEQQFAAECNAAVVHGAEKYYRNMFFGDELTWNLRDTHFLSTVSRISNHLSARLARAGRDDSARVVVWAHNSHLGDAAATDMGKSRGEVNLGQLMREQYGTDEVYNIGFTTHHGTVVAADEWDAPGQRKQVRPGMPGSYEALFHDVGIPAFALDFRGGGGGKNDDDSDDVDEKEKLEQVKALREALSGPLLERAIGVIYKPRTERQSHYFYAELPEQFDLVIHVDRTAAVRPLEPAHHSWVEEHLAKEDMPESYPFGV